MTPKKFYINWIDFISKECTTKSDWLNQYNDNNLWTLFTIGPKCSEEANSPFGEYLKNKIGLRYRKEDGSVDLAFADNKNFKNVLSLHKQESERINVVKENSFYPNYYEILVEHENNIYLCFEEMIKLTYFRARLKVLITYNENVDDTSDYYYANEILVTNFSKIISQANEKYPENMNTLYLLIVGQLNNGKLIWYFYTFNNRGELIIEGNNHKTKTNNNYP